MTLWSPPLTDRARLARGCKRKRLRVTVSRWHPSHAATPVHAVTDPGSEFARFQIRPDCERLPPHARHLERWGDYDDHRPLETREANGLRRLKVSNIEPLQPIIA